MTYKYGGVVRRLDVVDFKYKFVDKPILPNERKKDITLDDKINKDDEFRNAFMWLLIENYKQLDFNNYKRSKNSEKITNDYIEENNPVLEYLNEFCEVKADYFIKATVLFNDYNEKTIQKLSIKKFTKLMKYLGYEKKHIDMLEESECECLDKKIKIVNSNISRLFEEEQQIIKLA